MATTAPSIPPNAAASNAEPILEQGDQLSRDEFERRYQRMPRIQKAELTEATVYIPSPVRSTKHGEPHGFLSGWLIVYVSETPGVRSFENSSVRLDLDNEPQPDLVLIKYKGGRARISQDDYIEGPPELAVEIVGTSAAYDLHQKKALIVAMGFASTSPGLPVKTVSSGGNSAKANIKRSFQTPMGFCEVEYFPASGSIPLLCSRRT